MAFFFFYPCNVFGIFFKRAIVINSVCKYNPRSTKSRLSLEKIFPLSSRIRNISVPDSFCGVHADAWIRSMNGFFWSRVQRYWIRNLKWTLADPWEGPGGARPPLSQGGDDNQENRKAGVPGERPLGARGEPTTIFTHIWCRCRDLNPGHIGWMRQALTTSPPLIPVLNVFGNFRKMIGNFCTPFGKRAEIFVLIFGNHRKVACSRQEKKSVFFFYKITLDWRWSGYFLWCLGAV